MITVVVVALVALVVGYMLVFNPDIGQLIRDLRETPAERAAREQAQEAMYAEWQAARDAWCAKEIAEDEAQFAAEEAAEQAAYVAKWGQA